MHQSAGFQISAFEKVIIEGQIQKLFVGIREYHQVKNIKRNKSN